jgi:two-component system, OmpR family, alkaline phosphatase synthesis response regulator PhoP
MRGRDWTNLKDWSNLGNISIFWGKRGLSLSKAVGFDRLNQLHREILRRYQSGIPKQGETMSKTILVIDDNERLRTLVKSYLTQEGYRVATAANGREALFVARAETPDLILLDIMMPEMDGYEFMRLHRKEQETPIILLTAKLEETDTLLGLELGADDYITKPFSMRILAARIRAVLRRMGKETPEADVVRAADITLDRNGRSVKVADNPVDLTPSEFDILATLMTSPGRAFSRLDLLDRVQGTAYEGYERTIDVHVRNLRAKIEPDSRNPRYIETIYGIGYRFAAE